jgi:hypothetical protein
VWIFVCVGISEVGFRMRGGRSREGICRCGVQVDLCDNSPGGIGEVVDSRDGGAPGSKDGIAVGMLLVLGFGRANR